MLNVEAMEAQAPHRPAQAHERTGAAEFVAFFAEGWAVGATDPERFYAHFGGRMLPAAPMTQPLAAKVRGPAGLRQLFDPLFRAMPDLRGDVVSWGETDTGVLVELRLHGTLADRAVAWTVVDRIDLEDGRIAGRHSYFDPAPLVRALLSRPRASARLVPSLLRGRIKRKGDT
jgi:ketosteroid isomerase-like protein